MFIIDQFDSPIAVDDFSYLANVEGYLRAVGIDSVPPLEPNVLQLGGDIQAFTAALGTINDGDTVIIVVHSWDRSFWWDDNEYTGFGAIGAPNQGDDPAPVPPGFDTLQNVTFEIISCISDRILKQPAPPIFTLTEKFEAAMGGAANNHTKMGYQGRAGASAYFRILTVPPAGGALKADLVEARRMAIAHLSGDLAWQEHPPSNRPGTGGPGAINQDFAIQAQADAFAATLAGNLAGITFEVSVPDQVWSPASQYGYRKPEDVFVPAEDCDSIYFDRGSTSCACTCPGAGAVCGCAFAEFVAYPPAPAPGIINAAAMGARITDLCSECLPNVQTVSLIVANDDPLDVDDTLHIVDVSGGATDGDILATLPSPGDHPQALTTTLITGDPFSGAVFVSDDDPADVDDTIYRVATSDGSIVSSFPASSSSDRYEGRALVEGFIGVEFPNWPNCVDGGMQVTEAWVAQGDTLCLIDLSDGSTIRSLPAPCSSPQGLEMGFAVLETSELWVACDDTDLLYLIDTSDGSVIRTVDAPGDHSSGLTVFGVRASTDGLFVDALTLDLWQGEDFEDTMEKLSTADGSFISRIDVDECAVSDSEDATGSGRGAGLPSCACPGDANFDGVVNFTDLTIVLSAWLSSYPAGTGPGDANGDGIVNFVDVTLVLSNWLNSCS